MMGCGRSFRGPGSNPGSVLIPSPAPPLRIIVLTALLALPAKGIGTVSGLAVARVLTVCASTANVALLGRRVRGRGAVAATNRLRGRNIPRAERISSGVNPFRIRIAGARDLL